MHMCGTKFPITILFIVKMIFCLSLNKLMSLLLWCMNDVCMICAGSNYESMIANRLLTAKEKEEKL